MSRTRKHMFIGIFMAALLIFGSDTWCFDEDPDEKVTGPTKMAEVTLQKKMAAGLLTKELHWVRLSRYTQYVDQSGNKIPYDRLAVPCKALLVYEPELKGDPMAVSVTVKQLLPRASTAILIVPE